MLRVLDLFSGIGAYASAAYEPLLRAQLSLV